VIDWQCVRCYNQCIVNNESRIMSTTDINRIATRPLAEYAYGLKEKYDQTFGLRKKTFMQLFDMGEIQLSSVYENLLVATRNAHHRPTEKVSVDKYDVVRVDSMGRRTPLGDMKTTTLQKNGDKRRFVVSNVKNKIGKIYVIGWNTMTNEPNFFCLPPDEIQGTHPHAGYKIPVNPKTGKRTKGWYNDNYAYDTWEEMCLA